ncbi:hypothetical protein [Flagellimonas crocea]|uniref:hypothetical protein n=1 Tax=Flagellimonas crocea TaxID=3067311 RepID=UPI00296EF7FB|nr:hypothetical protein [Muricauda sp. DH64]
MKKSTPRTASNMEKLSKNSYDQALKEFETSLFDSNEQNTLKAKWAEAIVKQINLFAQINKFYKNMESTIRFDYIILFKVLSSIYTEKRLSYEALLDYINLQMEIKAFQKKFAKWLDDEFAIPFGLEYYLMGMPMKCANDNNMSMLSERYGKIYCDFYYGTLMIDMYVEKSMELVKEVIGEEHYDTVESEVQ